MPTCRRVRRRGRSTAPTSSPGSRPAGGCRRLPNHSRSSRSCSATNDAKNSSSEAKPLASQWVLARGRSESVTESDLVSPANSGGPGYRCGSQRWPARGEGVPRPIGVPADWRHPAQDRGMGGTSQRRFESNRCRGSVEAALGLVGALRETLHEAAELLEAFVRLPVLSGRVAGIDALEDDRELPVAERDVEVELGEVAAGALGVAGPDLLAVREPGCH